MFRFLVQRVLYGALTLWVVTTATFLLIQAAPGGPAILADPKLGPVERHAIEVRLGLDQPLGIRYLTWHRNVARGDFGRSFLYQTPAIDTIRGRLPNTVLLTGLALVAALGFAMPLAVAVGRRPGGWLDRSLAAINFTTLAIPAFWFGIVLILLVAARWRLLPAGGMSTPGLEDDMVDRLRHLVLPVLVLALPLASEVFRYARSGVIAGRRAPHLTPARARGLRERGVEWRHVVRNTLVSLLTVVGLQVPLLVGGAAVTETVFSWPGMGRLGVEAALGRDYPMVMAITVIVAVTVVGANLLIDLLYGLADPRVRLA
ncbi:MAG: ABC transporter permease [Gemmatimonadota bacterium]